MDVHHKRFDNGATRRFVADATTGSQLATAYLRFRLTRRAVMGAWVLIVAVLLIFGVVRHQIAVAAVMAVVLFPAVVLMVHLQTRQALRRLYSAGSEHTSVFGAGTLTVTCPAGAQDIRYRALRAVWTARGAVVLRRRAAAATIVLPAELVPADAVAAIRTGIADRPGDGTGHPR